MHKTLALQLRKLALDVAMPPDAARWAALLDRVDRAYTQGDQDLYLLERSLSLSSAEMQELYRKLQESSESQLAQEHAKLHALITSVQAGICALDAQGRILFVNPEGERLLEGSADELVGQPVLDRIVSSRITEGTAGLVAGLAIRDTEGTLLTPSGRRVPVAFVLTPLARDGGQVIAVLVFHDVSKERALRDQLSWQASHDMLTGLSNRAQFEALLRQTLAGMRGQSRTHAVLYLDLDQFKLVNDTCGHLAGDQLLRQIARRLETNIRSSDNIARLGGDEFGVLLYDCPVPQAELIAQTLRDSVRDFRFVWDQRPFSIGVSIGLVVLDDADHDLTDILSAADLACYTAKDLGRNRVHRFTADSRTVQRQGEMHWASLITQALEQDRFLLYHQPIVPVCGTGPAHYEVLMRMRDEAGHLIMPGAFIPPAERFNLMSKLDRWVIRNALRHLADGSDNGQVCAINLSANTLNDDDLLKFILATLEETGAEPGRVCFEITETAVIANLDTSLAIMDGLRQVGCRFALDDFGSGFSSLAYLRRLPVDLLKIDGQFIRTINTDPINRAMVEAIQRIASVMGLLTVAEFVENDEILGVLREIGVDYAQGYGVGMPAPMTDPEPAIGQTLKRA